MIRGRYALAGAFLASVLRPLTSAEGRRDGWFSARNQEALRPQIRPLVALASHIQFRPRSSRKIWRIQLEQPEHEDHLRAVVGFFQ